MANHPINRKDAIGGITKTNRCPTQKSARGSRILVEEEGRRGDQELGSLSPRSKKGLRSPAIYHPGKNLGSRGTWKDLTQKRYGRD